MELVACVHRPLQRSAQSLVHIVGMHDVNSDLATPCNHGAACPTTHAAKKTQFLSDTICSDGFGSDVALSVLQTCYNCRTPRWTSNISPFTSYRHWGKHSHVVHMLRYGSRLTLFFSCPDAGLRDSVQQA